MKSPTLPDIIQTFINNSIADIYKCLPAQIETYDETIQLASVKPLIKKKFTNDEVLALPIINNVPIVFPRSNDAIISFPLSKGDTVALLFVDRSMDEWLSSGDDVTPDDRRKHNISDAIGIPGLFPFSSTSPAAKDDLLIQYKESKIKIMNNGDIKLDAGPSGKIAIGNSQEELLDLIDQLIQALITTTTPTQIGPMMLSISTDTTLAVLATDLAKIKGSL